MSSYCVRCKRKTPDVNPRVVTTKNGKKLMKSTCGVCGAKKSSFMKS
jgi:hypothetical protein